MKIEETKNLEVLCLEPNFYLNMVVNVSLKIEKNSKSNAKRIKGNEKLYIDDSFNDYKKLLENQKELSIGTTFINILNEQEKILAIIEKSKNIIFESEKISDGDYGDFIGFMKDEFQKLNLLIVFLPSITKFEYYIKFEFFKNMQNIRNELYIAEKIWKSVNDEQHKKHYKQLKKELEYMESAKYIKDKSVEFLDNLSNQIKNIIDIVNSLFIPTYNNSYTNIYSDITRHLAQTQIEYTTKYTKHAIPYKYTYKIIDINEFFNASIYHIYLDKKSIKQCRACGEYFIGTNRVYCNKKYNEMGDITDQDNEDSLSCREYYSLKKSENLVEEKLSQPKPKSELLYNKILVRLKVRANRDPNKNKSILDDFKFHFAYNMKKKEFMKLCNGDVKRVETKLLKLYTKLDNEPKYKSKYK